MSLTGSSAISDANLVPASSVPPYPVFMIRRPASTKPSVASSDGLPENTADIQLNSNAKTDVKMGFDHIQHGMFDPYYQISLSCSFQLTVFLQPKPLKSKPQDLQIPRSGKQL